MWVCASVRAYQCMCVPVSVCQRASASVCVCVCVCVCQFAFLSVRAYQWACVQVYLSARLETDIQNLSSWFKANGMLFNGDKCQFLFIEYHAQLVINTSRKVKKENCRVSILPIMYKASQIWGNIPRDIQEVEDISTFKRNIINYCESICYCNLCKSYVAKVCYLDNNSARPL